MRLAMQKLREPLSMHRGVTRVSGMSHSEEAFPELSAQSHSMRCRRKSRAPCERACCRMPRMRTGARGNGQTVAILGELAPSAQINRGRSAGIRSRLLVRGRAERESDRTGSGTAGHCANCRESHRTGAQDHPGGQRPVTGDLKSTPAQTARVPLEAVPARRSVNWYAIATTLALVITGAQRFRAATDRNRMRTSAALDSVASPTDSIMTMQVARFNDCGDDGSRRESCTAHQPGRARAARPRRCGTARWNDWIMVTYNLRQPKPGMTSRSGSSPMTRRSQRERSIRTRMAERSCMPVMRWIAMHYALSPITEEPEGGVPAPDQWSSRAKHN